MTVRRLDAEERRAITSGNVYVWEERGSSTEATGLGIERWCVSLSAFPTQFPLIQFLRPPARHLSSSLRVPYPNFRNTGLTACGGVQAESETYVWHRFSNSSAL